MSKETNEVRYNNMLLINDKLQDGTVTFSAIPTTNDCPFVELLFNPANKTLAAINKVKKVTFQFVPRLDDAGNVVANTNKRTAGNVPIKQERKQIEIFHEHYIYEKDEIISFVKMFASNGNSFDIERYFL